MDGDSLAAFYYKGRKFRENRELDYLSVGEINHMHKLIDRSGINI